MHGCSLFFKLLSEFLKCLMTFFSFWKNVADNSLVFASHSCRAWFLYVCFPGAHKICAVMQGAPPDQMGASYPHMFLILLLLHGANAASKAPAGPKWQTLSGILFLLFFLLSLFFHLSRFSCVLAFVLPAISRLKLSDVQLQRHVAKLLMLVL
jgi:hypothetical protein